MKETLPPRLKRKLREYRLLLRHFRDSLSSVDVAEFEKALKSLGIEAGDLVYVRSRYDDMRTIKAGPVEVLDLLSKLVGDEGTIVMPTYPTNGLTAPYLSENPHFHWRRTPSLSGMLTEVFRRLPTTQRSLHPTHSVAARGKLAASLTEGHEDSSTPFDENSPYQKLLAHDAKLLSIGHFDSLPMRHLADHLIQDLIPWPLYTEEPIRVRLIDRQNKEHERNVRTHNPAIRCNHEVALQEMNKEGLVARARVGRVPLTLVGLRSFVASYRRYYEQGLIRHVPRTDSDKRIQAGA